jgi:hypothetical protein
MPGQDCQDRIASTEQLGHDSQNRTAGKRAARRRKPEEDNWNKTAGQDRHKRTAGTE